MSTQMEYWRKQHRKRCNELEDAYFKIQSIENQLHQRYEKALRGDEIMKYLTNDCVYICTKCEEIFKVYSTSGETNFCPYCGANSKHFEEYEGEVNE